MNKYFLSPVVPGCAVVVVDIGLVVSQVGGGVIVVILCVTKTILSETSDECNKIIIRWKK